MKVLSDERSKILAEQYGWSLAYAQGSVEGERSRRLGQSPSLHALVGIDEYSKGFRAAYFERHTYPDAQGGRMDIGPHRATRMNAG